MPKKHSGSKKSKSEKQSKLQQWVARYRAFVDKAGKQWVHRGPNRKDVRKYHSKSSGGGKGRQHTDDKGRHRAAIKARNRRLRKDTRALHQSQRSS